MKFAYKDFGKNEFGERVLRPIIPITFSKGKVDITYEALVDSGADGCIFDAEIAELLGIDLEKGKKAFFSGITGTPRVQYLHPITLQVGGWDFKTTVGFATHLSKIGHGIVGQRGFFDLFVVKFDYQKAQLELKPKQ